MEITGNIFEQTSTVCDLPLAINGVGVARSRAGQVAIAIATPCGVAMVGSVARYREGHFTNGCQRASAPTHDK